MILGPCPTLKVLREALKGANQLWLTSTLKECLTTTHLDLIVDEWRNGLSMYIFGDNYPYFVDANRLLKVGMHWNGACPGEVLSRDKNVSHTTSSIEPSTTPSNGAAAVQYQNVEACVSYVRVQAMGLPQMEGDYKAGEMLSPFNPKTGRGFKAHMVTTGITSKLFEGYTIAEFKAADVSAKRCIPIMYNSQGGISVILKEPLRGAGQVRVLGCCVIF